MHANILHHQLLLILTSAIFKRSRLLLAFFFSYITRKKSLDTRNFPTIISWTTAMELMETRQMATSTVYVKARVSNIYPVAPVWTYYVIQLAFNCW